ncbi:MAG: TcpQ domain-containing protein [Gammaproteobacteria bacterium]|nr:TcpQ domain-containing protein [Gammaproteobacteria bacterium]
MKQSKQHTRSKGYILKIIIPIILVLVVLGVLFWTIGGDPSGKKTTHQMADGVAKFYATFRSSFMPGDEQLDDYIIKMPENDKSVTRQLQERGATVTPQDQNWTGEVKRRRFKENDTLRNAIKTYGESEGVELIWDLKYDYIIKHHFQEQSSYTQLVELVTKTVNNDYDGKVRSYFCPQERAVVVTAEEIEYLQQFCTSTTSKRRLAIDKKRERDYQLRKKLGID